MKRLFFFCLTACVLAACGKDKFQTVPQVEINSLGPSEVQKRQIIRLSATVTDDEGDLQDTVIIVRKRYNGTMLLGSADSSIRVKLSDFGVPIKRKFELTFDIPYGEQLQSYQYFQQQENAFDRNFAIGIIIKDNAGHRSEYVESEKIVLKKI